MRGRPPRQFSRPRPVRPWPGGLESRGLRLARFECRRCRGRIGAQLRRQQIGRQGFAGARLGAFALLPRGRGEQQVAPPGRGPGPARVALPGAPRRGVREAASSCQGGGAEAAGAAGSPPGLSIAGWSRVRGNRCRRGLPARAGPPPRLRLQGRFRIRMGRQGIASRCAMRLQLPTAIHRPISDHAGAGADHAGQDERAADAELLVLNPVADRQQARHNEANPSDQHHHHHRTHPQQPARSCAGRLVATIPS